VEGTYARPRTQRGSRLSSSIIPKFAHLHTQIACIKDWKSHRLPASSVRWQRSTPRSLKARVWRSRAVPCDGADIEEVVDVHFDSPWSADRTRPAQLGGIVETEWTRRQFHCAFRVDWSQSDAVERLGSPTAAGSDCHLFSGERPRSINLEHKLLVSR
jgi:hypothetical protein